MRTLRFATILLCGFLLMGFTSYFGNSVSDFYREYEISMPRKGKVTVCITGGCLETRPYTYSASDIATLRGLMLVGALSPKTERTALTRAVGWMERRLGRSDTDCIAETANVMSLLLVMQKRGLLKYHKVVRPGGKWSFSRWPHWAARIRDGKGQIWSVDSFFVTHGKNAQVVRWESWYLPEG